MLRAMNATKAAVPNPRQVLEAHHPKQHGGITPPALSSASQDADDLHHPEQPQRAIDANPDHDDAAYGAAEHAGPQAGHLGDGAHLGH